MRLCVERKRDARAILFLNGGVLSAGAFGECCARAVCFCLRDFDEENVTSCVVNGVKFMYVRNWMR
jgi:hypothetical protein